MARMRKKYIQGFGGNRKERDRYKTHTQCKDNIKKYLKRKGDGGCGEDSSAPGQELGAGFENTVIIFSEL